MAGEIQKIGLDVSDLTKGMRTAIANFQEHAKSVENLTITYVKLNEKGKQVEAGFKALTSAGTQIQGTIDKLGTKWKAHADIIRTNTQALKEFQAQQARTAASTALASAAPQAQGFVNQILGGQRIENLTPVLARQIQGIQTKLADAISKDPQALLGIQQIFGRLQAGFVDVETGIRARIQSALISLLGVEQKISAERRKQLDITSQETKGRTQGPTTLGFARNLAQQFPVPTNASLDSVIRFQAALTRVVQIAQSGKIPLQDMQQLLQRLVRSPNQNIAFGLGNLQQAQTAIQRLILEHQNLSKVTTETGNAVERAGARMLISLQGVFRLLQAQVLHRVFGSLITDMTNAVSSAATLEQRIAEIRTISETSNQSFEQLRGTISRLSVEFNRPAIQVAEGLYEGFSNQVIRTASDTETLGREFLRLSRITASTVPGAVNALSSVLNAYQLPATDATRITDQLFQAVDVGRFRLEDIAGTLGRVTVSASQLGISFEEVLAFMTLVTRQGVTTHEAMTQLSSLTQELLRPTEAVSNLFRQWGFTSGEAAIRTLGFTGTLERLIGAVQRGEIELTSLSNNVRGQRGLLGILQGSGGLQPFRTEVQQFIDVDALRQRAERAGQEIAAPVGDRFRAELNKIQTMFETEIGPRLLQAIVRLGEPFGGLSELVRRLVEALEAVARVALEIAQVFANVGGFLDKLGLSFGNLTIAAGAYLLGTRLIIPVLGTLSQVTLSHTGVMIRNQAVMTVAEARLVRYAAVARGASAASVTATQSTIAWGTALKSAFATIAPIAIIAVIAEVINLLKSSQSEAERLQERLETLQATNREIQREIEQTLAEEGRQFRNLSTAQERAFGELLAPLQRRINELRDAQREAFRNTSNDLAEASRTVADQMAGIVSRLRESITNSERDIEDSLKRIQKFGDELDRTLFQSRLRFAGQGPTEIRTFRNDAERQEARTRFEAESIGRQNQIALIQQRIGQLNREALELRGRGDRESMEAARQRFDEIRRLTEQQFELETDQRRQQTLLQLREPGATRPGEIIRFGVNFNELQRRLQAVNDQARSFEETFQNSQRVIEANARALLELERQRQVQITRTQQQLTQFTLLDPQGQLQQRFRGEGGLQRAIQEFDRLSQAARAALEPIRLTEEEMQRLRARVGEHQAASIAQAAREGSITAQQQAELQASLGERRFQQLQQQLQQHTITQQAIRELERTIAAQRAQIQEQYQREVASQHVQEIRQRIQREFQAIREQQAAAQTAIRENTRQQSEATESSLRLIQQARDRARELAPLGVALTPQIERALPDVNRRIQEAETARSDFLSNRSVENAQRLATALQRLSESFDNLQASTRVGRGSTVVTDLADAGRQVLESTNNLSTARQTLRDVQAQADGITVSLGQLAGRLNGLGLDAGQVGEALGRAMNQAAGNLENVAQQIGNLATQIQRLLAAAQGQGTAPALPVGPAPLVEANAAGGLIGQAFGSRGPDDRLSWVRTGEFVVNPESTRRFYSQLVAINKGSYPRYSEGGLVSRTTVGDININIDGSRNPDATARAVMGKIRREVRRRNGRF